MTPEHNPPKDPALAETKVLPRKVCDHGYLLWSCPFPHCEFRESNATPAPSPVLGDATAPAARLATLMVDKAELDKLCAFILMNFTGEWDRKESTADVAIRYLKTTKALMEAVAQAREALKLAKLAMEDEYELEDGDDPKGFFISASVPGTIEEIDAALALLESPALVSIIQPDGGKV